MTTRYVLAALITATALGALTGAAIAIIRERT
jgi:hypothetical protein